MSRSYSDLHRGSDEWSRKIRKATEHRRLRHASRGVMHEATLLRGLHGEDLDFAANPTPTPEHP